MKQYEIVPVPVSPHPFVVHISLNIPLPEKADVRCAPIICRALRYHPLISLYRSDTFVSSSGVPRDLITDRWAPADGGTNALRHTHGN
ncbi:hypothetical protein BaRGS_00025900 [Batillaria attramentaria]|uniref:Uncharacterized protein n=1 Tax=Batillaria attramentaria TaxID=370345 RepID=A0ABD0K7H4_9CAEN